MIPIVKNLAEPIKTVGLAASFSPMSHKIPELWDIFVPRMSEIAQRSPNGLCFGTCMESHESIAKNTPNEFVYMAAHAVDNFAETLPDGMIAYTIPAGKYAVFTHKGGLDKFHETLNFIYRQWMPTIQRRPDAPDFEWYDDRFNPHSADSEVDVYIPIF